MFIYFVCSSIFNLVSPQSNLIIRCIARGSWEHTVRRDGGAANPDLRGGWPGCVFQVNKEKLQNSKLQSYEIYIVYSCLPFSLLDDR